MKDRDLGMKNKLTHKAGTVKALMNQGVGCGEQSNPLGDVKALMNNGGAGPHAGFKKVGRSGVGKLMNQK